jgi:putative spermidine/putrescine transport system ATP-binding protein
MIVAPGPRAEVVVQREPAFKNVRVRNVSRAFGSFQALHDFDLTIEAGEFIALLGPSGCGKSTALNCIAGLLPLSGGEIWIDERRIDGLLPEQRDFGMVFQNYALFPHLSAWKNVAFGLEMRKIGREEIRRRVAEALALVHLTEHAEKFPAQLSGGQQQRVAIARAIVFRPSLVLMDEPLSNLDARFRLEMRTEILRLHRQTGSTTVYVTHDQEEALSMADRLVVMCDGVIQQVDAPENVYAHPVNLYVANFMGYRNVFELDLVAAGGGIVELREPGLQLRGSARETLDGTRAVAAIRPEDFVISAGGEGGTPVTVEIVEYQGREFLIEGKTSAGRRVIFRTDRRCAIGETVNVTVAPERVLVFAAGTEATS